MTTPLTHVVSRRTTVTRDAGKRIVVTLEPGDVIGFRLERTRKTYWLTLEGAYHAAVKADVAKARAERKRK